MRKKSTAVQHALEKAGIRPLPETLVQKFSRYLTYLITIILVIALALLLGFVVYHQTRKSDQPPRTDEGKQSTAPALLPQESGTTGTTWPWFVLGGATVLALTIIILSGPSIRLPIIHNWQPKWKTTPEGDYLTLDGEILETTSVKGDGLCLFHSIAHHLPFVDNGRDLAENFTEWQHNTQTPFPENELQHLFEVEMQHLNYRLMHGTAKDLPDAGILVPQIANYLQRPIRVFSAPGRSDLYEPKVKMVNNVLNILRLDFAHFEPVERIK